MIYTDSYTPTPRMKMADLINSAPGLLAVMYRYGMAPGFGDSSVEECCRKHGKDPFTFIAICRTAMDGSWAPSAVELSRLKVSDIVTFLKNSHDSYQDTWLPYIKEQITATMAEKSEQQRKVISEFFGKFREELEKHFALEEKKIFPSLEAMMGGKPRSFRHEHGDIDEKIQDLINLLLKYIPASGTHDEVTGLLTQLYFLREDLSVHSRIEEALIMPLLTSER